MKRIKSFAYLIITLILEMIVLSASLLTSTLSQYKVKNMTSKIMKKSFSNLLIHPFNTIVKMISEKNPILIIGTIIVIVYMIYVIYKSNHKDTYKIEEKYAVHGSSRYATNKEIFVENETIGIPVKQIFEDLKNSFVIGSDNDNEEKE
ncbi:hypothetical protein [uncultured Clostridium sp.]|uniref:hypothetical protein n=1 Tax=uncultured Clostridium sp. TaxID=59620 RepID=UPI00260C8030|nr:hypothetical protein [uncultured Clostridium sp.]